ncbi:MAG: arylsulfatase [Pirellulales bacterium]
MNLFRLAAVACIFGGTLPSQADEPRPPNILWIVADDLGYGELGCYGQQTIRTPNLDELAAEGMRFMQYYAGSPVCAPSRCVMMTGKHTGHAAIRDNREPNPQPLLKAKYGWEFPGQTPLPAEEVTIAELLKQRGYATAAIGKWGLGHFGTTGDPLEQGFDFFYGYNCQRHAHNHYPRFLWRNRTKEELPGNRGEATGETYSQDRFMAEAESFLREKKSQPWLLYLPLTVPHLAIQVPEESLAQYAGKLSEEEYDHKGYFPHPTPHAGYAAMVSHMDAGLGRIFELLEELNLDDNTLVLITSDNGPTHGRTGGADSDFFNSSAGLRGRKGSVYEGGLRVPLIVRWPGKIAAGQTSNLPCAAWDLLPTFCGAVGIEPPKGTDGISLLPTLLDQGEQARHDLLYWEFPSYGGQQAVRWGNWKALRVEMSKGNRTWELYDMETDFNETTDVAQGQPQVVAKIAALADANRQESKLFRFLKP